MSKKPDRRIHAVDSRFKGRAVTEFREVRVLAIAGAWAMVCRPGAMPYVCHASELVSKATLVKAGEP